MNCTRPSADRKADGGRSDDLWSAPWPGQAECWRASFGGHDRTGSSARTLLKPARRRRDSKCMLRKRDLRPTGAAGRQAEERAGRARRLRESWSRRQPARWQCCRPLRRWRDTLAPGPEKFAHPCLLACRQVGRQQVGTVYGRVLALLPRHQAGFFVREPLVMICI